MIGQTLIENKMVTTKWHLLRYLAVIFGMALAGCSTIQSPDTPIAKNLVMIDDYTLAGNKHLVRDYAPLDSAGHICVVIEIPTGAIAKWEVNKSTGRLEWQKNNGQPRRVAYLGYPGNYGMIPKTLLPKASGGYGDPLDVLVLGPALPRGSVVYARAIGILKLRDGGEQDDKIIAVLPGSQLGNIKSVEQLKEKFKGSDKIIEIWFSNYKGPGNMISGGFAGRDEAEKVIKVAVEAYRREKAEVGKISNG
jgi:inorganic pyrophosphatase